MCWNPPDPSDYVDRILAEEVETEDEIYSIRVFQLDGSTTIEEYSEVFEFHERVYELWVTNTEYEVIYGPDSSIPY